MHNERSHSINQLNSFLRGEISAVESYRQALDRVKTASVRTALEECARSHDERVRSLSETVTRLGGTPSRGSGAWGVLAQSVEAGALLFGEKEAVGALEEGENHGLRDYVSDLEKLDLESRDFVSYEVLPKQKETQASIAKLKRELS